MCRMYLKNSEPRENTWYCFSWLVTYNLVADCKLDLGEPSKYIIFHVFACLFILGEFSSLIALINEVPSPKKREDSSHFWTVTRPLLFWPFLRSGPPLGWDKIPIDQSLFGWLPLGVERSLFCAAGWVLCRLWGCIKMPSLQPPPVGKGTETTCDGRLTIFKLSSISNINLEIGLSSFNSIDLLGNPSKTT